MDNVLELRVGEGAAHLDLPRTLLLRLAIQLLGFRGLWLGLLFAQQTIALTALLQLGALLLLLKCFDLVFGADCGVEPYHLFFFSLTLDRVTLRFAVDFFRLLLLVSESIFLGVTVVEIRVERVPAERLALLF